jgi:hypothetical protein
MVFQDRERYKVGDAASFHYLNQSNCINLDAMDDSSEYVATRRAMDIVGISSDEQVSPRLCLKLVYFIRRPSLLNISITYLSGCHIQSCCCYSSLGQCGIF